MNRRACNSFSVLRTFSQRFSAGERRLDLIIHPTVAQRQRFVQLIFPVRLTAFGEELATSERGTESPNFRVLVEGKPQALHPQLQDDLYRIAREAVANAFRHSKA